MVMYILETAEIMSCLAVHKEKNHAVAFASVRHDCRAYVRLISQPCFLLFIDRISHSDACAGVVMHAGLSGYADI